MNNISVAHEWAHGFRENAKGSNFFFVTDLKGNRLLYSYGYHFCCGVVTKDGTYYITTRRYSSSTDKHLVYMRGAIPHGVRKVYTPFPELVSEGFWSGTAFTNWYINHLDKVARKIAVAKSAKDRYISEYHAIIEEAEIFCDAIGVQLPERLQARKTDFGDLERFREERKRANEAKRERELQWKNEKLKWAADRIERFNNYESNSVYGLDHDILRLSKDQTAVETSKGISIPIMEAKRFGASGLLHKVEKWVVNAEMSNADDIVIGCHRFKRQYLIDFYHAIKDL